MNRFRIHASMIAFVILAGAGFLRAQEAPQHAAVTPVPREGGWLQRHESFNQRVKQGNVDLIFIGDSITQGWEGAGKKVWEEHYGKRNAVNLGISGDRTQHVLWRLDHGNIEGISPKVAVIMIGTNNAGSNTSQEIADGVEAIVKKHREKLPETKVLVLGIFPRGEDKNNPARKVNEGANERIAKLADDTIVYYQDLAPAFLNDDATLSKEIMPDLLHLSEKGYQIWAESIEEKIAELMGEKK